MATTQQATARDIGTHFAANFRDEPVVVGLWVGAIHNYLGVWVLTESIEMDAERHLYEVGVRLRRDFLDNDIWFEVVNPRHYLPETQFVGNIIPATATAIPLHV